MQGKLIIITAPSGSGKTTICRHLLEVLPQLKFSVSATTRNMRDGEIDGKDYYFLSNKNFEEKIKNNEFLEHEEVYKDTSYGTLKSEVERLWNQNFHVLFDIDVKGALNLKNTYPENSLFIYIKTPLDQLEIRLRKRQSESEETLKIRLAKAAEEMEFIQYADVIIDNEILEVALQKAEVAVTSFIQN